MRQRLLAALAGLVLVFPAAACTGTVTDSQGQEWTFACTGPTAVPASPTPGGAQCSWAPVPTPSTQDPTTPPPTTSAPPPTTPPPTTPPPTTPPPASGFPTPATTGVPQGTVLTNATSCNVAAGTTVTARRFNCDPLVIGANAVVRNSEITGRTVMGANSTVEDSTLRSGQTCNGNAAIGPGDFTARGLEVVGWGDGVRVEDGLGGTLVEDSFFDLCETTETHGDGIQGYIGGANNTFRHNTVDQPNGTVLDGITANIFWADGSGGNFRVENNLLIGGGYTIRVYHYGGAEHVVTGNRIVANSWRWGPTDSTCDTASNTALMHWVDNDTVTINSNYEVTGTVANNIPCA
jgi:hypothetical protein